jgi:hypothetical protein
MTPTNNKHEIAAAAMKQAMAWLDERQVRYHHLPPHQIKIGVLNYWPGTGTITLDGEIGKRPVKGLAGLESILFAVETSVRRPQLSLSDLIK